MLTSYAHFRGQLASFDELQDGLGREGTGNKG